MVHYQRRFQCLYKERINVTIIISCFNVVWLNFYHWNDMYWLCIIYIIIVIVLWIINNNLDPTVQWRLYHSTHCGWNNLVGTWIFLHRAMHNLKASNTTLTPHSLLMVLVFSLSGLLWPWGLTYVRLQLQCLCNEALPL